MLVELDRPGKNTFLVQESGKLTYHFSSMMYVMKITAVYTLEAFFNRYNECLNQKMFDVGNSKNFIDKIFGRNFFFHDVEDFDFTIKKYLSDTLKNYNSSHVCRKLRTSTQIQLCRVTTLTNTKLCYQ